MNTGRKKGTPKTGGRRKGTPNKVTAEVREAAKKHGPAALAELARLMSEAQSEQVRIAACREILDRGYGKSRMAVEHTGPESGPIPVKKLDDKESMRRLATFFIQDGLLPNSTASDIVENRANTQLRLSDTKEIEDRTCD